MWDDEHSVYAIGEASDRAKINFMYAEIGRNKILELLDVETDSPEHEIIIYCFGLGKNKRQGVLEQIGRISESQLLSDSELKAVIIETIKLIEQGQPIKEIERQLRQAREEYKNKNKLQEHRRNKNRSCRHNKTLPPCK